MGGREAKGGEGERDGPKPFTLGRESMHGVEGVGGHMSDREDGRETMGGMLLLGGEPSGLGRRGGTSVGQASEDGEDLLVGFM